MSSPFRMVFCFHNSRNIPSMINLIEASRGTGKRDALLVYAMHLMELSERSSAILMVHKAARRNGLLFWNKGQDSDSNQIVVAFEAFQHLSKVSIRPTTAISAMSSMHEDICNGAEHKRAAMVILPFHKNQRLDGQLETTRAEFRQVNRKVLEHAPCSVGILVDRGLGGATHISASNVNYVVTVLFFGGHDDHEALAYGLLMAEHPGINLIVVHFVLDPNVIGKIVSVEIDELINAKTRSVDEEVVTELKEKVSKNNSIKYEKRVVSGASETREIIREYTRCNLFLVGRTAESELAVALKRQTECPELGPIGSLLTSVDFTTAASVLVVQQYRSPLSTNSLASLTEEELTDQEDHM